LRISLASDGERALFDNYFRLYRPKLGEALPALIPQVYLHYDPAVVKFLRHRTGLRRQRMDFLLLLPNNRRVVLEVDGTQHFSRDDKPSLAAYAEMAAADRDLRLSGYEVYRFGANELTAAGAGLLIEKLFRSALDPSRRTTAPVTVDRAPARIRRAPKDDWGKWVRATGCTVGCRR
jgi:very-short-patch-repair endonuclease